MSTDTPRTDSEALWPACNDDSDKRDPAGLYVYADFARQLERELAQARAECEQLRQEMREYEHHVMTGRNEQHDRLVAETERLRAEVEAVRSLLDDAADDIQDWGCYASEYFREKHDLMGCINKYRDAARSKP